MKQNKDFIFTIELNENNISQIEEKIASETNIKVIEPQVVIYGNKVNNRSINNTNTTDVECREVPIIVTTEVRHCICCRTRYMNHVWVFTIVIEIQCINKSFSHVCI